MNKFYESLSLQKFLVGTTNKSPIVYKSSCGDARLSNLLYLTISFCNKMYFKRAINLNKENNNDINIGFDKTFLLFFVNSLYMIILCLLKRNFISFVSINSLFTFTPIFLGCLLIKHLFFLNEITLISFTMLSLTLLICY